MDLSETYEILVVAFDDNDFDPLKCSRLILLAANRIRLQNGLRPIEGIEDAEG